MTEPKDLYLMTAFQDTLNRLFLCTCHPDDYDPNTSSFTRSILLSLEGKTAKISHVLSHAIETAWRAKTGKVYCTSTGGQIYSHQGEGWKREVVCDRPINFKWIHGFSGESEKDEVVFLPSVSGLFIKKDGQWSEHPMPEGVEMIQNLHGLSPDDVYICTDAGLVHWDGKELSLVEAPDDNLLLSVLVLSDDEMLLAGKKLYCWTEKTGWKKLKSPAKTHTVAMVKWNNDVWIGTSDGVLRRSGNKMELVTKAHCNGLFDLGTGLLADGDEILLFDGKAWNQLTLPKLAVEEIPRIPVAF